MSQIQQFTPLTAAALALAANSPIMARTLSLSSNISCGSASSVLSRVADDMLDRLAAQSPDAVMHLWSAGNVRLPNGRDLTIPAGEADKLIKAMKADVRFQYIKTQQFNEEGDDWKITFQRVHSSNETPIHSDSE